MARAEHAWLDPPMQAEPASASVLRDLRARGLPGAHDEHWAHAHLRALDNVQHLMPIPASSAAAAAERLQELPARLPGVPRLLIVDGHPLPQLSDVEAVAACTPLGGAPPPLDIADPDLRYAGLVRLQPEAAVQLRIARGAVRCTELLYVHSGQPGSVYPQLQVQLAADARLTLIERHSGAIDPASLLCTGLDMRLESGAVLEFHRLHELRAGSLVLDQLQLQLGTDAAARVHQISVGGGNVRQTLSARLTGRGARLDWSAAAVQSGSEYHDVLVRTRLEAENTRADTRYRGLAADRAHLSCTADGIVAATARGAQLRQSLRGLADGRGAHVNLRPRLEINTDDVQAAHGATTGQLDEQLLFYLLSRGLDADSARALLKWAFLGDVLGMIREPDLRRAAEQLAARHVGDEAIRGLARGLT